MKRKKFIVEVKRYCNGKIEDNMSNTWGMKYRKINDVEDFLIDAIRKKDQTVTLDHNKLLNLITVKFKHDQKNYELLYRVFPLKDYFKTAYNSISGPAERKRNKR